MIFLGLLAGSAAKAETKGVLDGLRTPPNAAYAEECGACHLPYPAEFLPATSWNNLIKDWAHHFKVDAVPDAANLKPISRYLLDNARPKAAAEPDPPPERITTTRWFRDRHKEIHDGTWPKVKTPANCAACHPKAAESIYRELVKRKPRRGDRTACRGPFFG